MFDAGSVKIIPFSSIQLQKLARGFAESVLCKSADQTTYWLYLQLDEEKHKGGSPMKAWIDSKQLHHFSLLTLSAIAMSFVIIASPALAIEIIDLSEGGTPHQGLIKTKTKLTLGLDTLNREYQAYLKPKRRGDVVEESFTSKRTMARVVAGRVVIDAVAVGSTEDLVENLKGLGAQITGVAGRLVSAWFPLEKLSKLEALSTLKFAHPAVAFTNTGSVTSQGDIAQYSDLGRLDFGVDGTGSMVGILSDSFDCSGNGSYAEDVLSGDLPAGVIVLEDLETGCTDEGRAMAQVVHDVAPGAKLAFHTGFIGQANFVQGINDLAAAGADIIVDGVSNMVEPWFQDGVAAQTVDQMHAMGVAYFTTASNEGRQAYEAAFLDSGLIGPLGGALHDFDPGPGVDTRIGIRQLTMSYYGLQWQDPFFSVSGEPGASTDLDICLYRSSHATNPIFCRSNINTGGDPFEGLGIIGSGDIEFSIERISGPEPGLIKLLLRGDIAFVDSYPGINAGSIFGHSNASGANAVGASAYFLTPAFGVDPPILNHFSSAGNTPILFDTAGNPILEIREKPEFTAPDGGNNTFFGGFGIYGRNYDNDQWPNFFGTCASAPHAAAVAALLREVVPTLSPAKITEVLQETAIDILQRTTLSFDGPLVFVGEGYDNDSGAGLIDAWAALDALSNGECDLATVPETLDFGSVLLGETSTQSVVLENRGSIACNVNELEVSGDPFALNPATPSVPIQIGAGGSVSIPIDYTPIEPGPDDGTLELEVDDPEDQEIEVKLVGEGYTALQEADLALTKTDSPDPVKTGSELTYTITVENLGPATASGIIMTDELPTRVNFISVEASQGSCSGSDTLVCNLESLEAGASAVVQIVVNPTESARLSNTASVEAIEDDPDDSNNSATEITRVRKTGHKRHDRAGHR